MYNKPELSGDLYSSSSSSSLLTTDDDRRILNSDLREELELVESRKSSQYGRTVNLIDSMMKLSSMQLMYNPNNVNYPIRNVIKLSATNCSPPNFANSKPMNLIWRQPLLRPLWLIYLSYIAIKHLIMAIIRYKHDSLYKILFPSSLPEIIIKTSNATAITSGSGHKCNLIDSNHNDPLMSSFRHRFNQSQFWLNYLGDPISSINGYSIIVYAFCYWSIVLIHMVAVYDLSKPKRGTVDVLGFMMDPLEMRQEMKRKLDVIVTVTIDTLEGLHNMSKSNYCINQKKLIENQANTTASSLSSAKYSNDNHRKLIHSILYCSNLIKPANLRANWHRRLLNLAEKHIKILALFFFHVGLVTIVGIVLGELYFRTKQRYETFECKRWNKDAIYTKGILLLDDIGPGSDLESYKATSGSLTELLYLALFVESKYYISLKRLVTLFEILLMTNLMTPIIWSPFRTWLLSAAVMDKVLWLDQIDEQLDNCLNQLQVKSNSSSQNDVKLFRKKQQDDNEEKLIKSMIVTYLNYMLFKSRYPDFKYTTNFNMAHYCYFMLAMMATLYGVATNSEISYNFLLIYLTSAIILFINLYLVSGTIPLRKVCKIMKSANRLVVYEKQYSNENLRLIMDLWRGQLLERNEMFETYAFRMLGKNVTLGWLFGFNANSVALLLLFLRWI